MNATIKDFVNICHMNLCNVHLSKGTGIIESPNCTLHGKHVVKETSTVVIDFMAGKYGKTTETWYLAEPNSQTFKSFEELVKQLNKQFYK